MTEKDIRSFFIRSEVRANLVRLRRQHFETQTLCKLVAAGSMDRRASHRCEFSTKHDCFYLQS
jgi:hypothetical protein